MTVWWLAGCGAFTPAVVEHGELDDSGGETGGEAGGGAGVPVSINELMPDNDAALIDDRGGTPDWIELYNPADATIDLSGWGVTDDREDPYRARLPDGTALAPGAFLLLYADAPADAATGHLGFALDASGGEVGLFHPDGRGSVVTYGGIAGDFSVARVPDGCDPADAGEAGCWVFDYRGTPGAANAPHTEESVVFVPAGATWAYWDAATPPGGEWAAVGYDDSAWARGPAPLGYGEVVGTTLSYGDDPDHRPITAWFRAAVGVHGAGSVTALTATLRRDDGAIVYLNGVEVVRSNLPEGAVSAYTPASTEVDGTLETARFRFALDPAALVEGTNVVAVELHQHSADSDDAVFDLALEGVRAVE